MNSFGNEKLERLKQLRDQALAYPDEDFYLEAWHQDVLRWACEEIENVRKECDWYKDRYKTFMTYQSQMRDPERRMVCDILANGSVGLETLKDFQSIGRGLRKPNSVEVKVDD